MTRILGGADSRAPDLKTERPGFSLRDRGGGLAPCVADEEGIEFEGAHGLADSPSDLSGKVGSGIDPRFDQKPIEPPVTEVTGLQCHLEGAREGETPVPR